MVHLHMKQKGLKSTKRTTPDIDLEDNCTTSIVFCATMYHSTTQEGKVYSELCVYLSIMSNKGNIYIYVTYVYDCNAILKTPTNNRSDKDMIRAFKELTTDSKSRGIKPGLLIMNNEVSTKLESKCQP